MSRQHLPCHLRADTHTHTLSQTGPPVLGQMAAERVIPLVLEGEKRAREETNEWGREGGRGRRGRRRRRGGGGGEEEEEEERKKRRRRR